MGKRDAKRAGLCGERGTGVTGVCVGREGDWEDWSGGKGALKGLMWEEESGVTAVCGELEEWGHWCMERDALGG